MNKFSDFAAEETQLDGEKEKVDNILDKEIIIKNFRLQNSKFKNKSGQYATVQFCKGKENKTFIFFTGSDVLVDQLQRYKEKLPFAVIIKKINRYYTLS